MYIPCIFTPVLDLSLRTFGFDLRSVHLGFEWTKLTLGPDILHPNTSVWLGKPPHPHLTHTHISVVYHESCVILPTDDVVK